MFKTKIIKLGNGRAVYLPRDVYTSYNIGDEIELDVYTNVYTEKKPDVYTNELSGTKVITEVITTKEQAEEAVKEIKPKKQVEVATLKPKKRYNSPFSICPKSITYSFKLAGVSHRKPYKQPIELN